MFNAILIQDKETNTTQITALEQNQLPEHDVLVKVDYSTLNYKDALAITGKGPVVTNFPMVPGIDFSGHVVASKSAKFKVGDAVVLNGWGVGEKHWGGLSQYASVKAEWLVPLPKTLTTKDAMSLGTAGYTAMLCVQALEQHGIKPEDGAILVTGAAGGVGSIATYLLAKRGYSVTVSTGRPEDQAYLKGLGAKDIIERSRLSEPNRPLQKEQWAGAIDVVGSHTLANVCASIKYGGAVAACGLAQGMDLPATVFPFILRSVSLLGVDSVYRSTEQRLKAWNALAQEIDSKTLAEVTTEITLSDVVEQANDLLKGRIRGRVVVDVNR